MHDFILRHEIECDEETYWFKCVFNDEYNERLYLKELRFPKYDQVKYEDDGKIIHRIVRGEPLLPPLPGPVKKVIGEGPAYSEDGSFDRATRHYVFKATPNSLGDKAKTQGDMSVEVLGDKRIARVAKLHVEVKVFMVGGLIEDQIINSLKTSYEKAAAFTNVFIREKGY